MRGQHTSTDGRQGLGESEHGDIHFVGQAEMRSGTSTTGAKDTKTMRIVHHHACSVFLCQRTYLRQFADVSAHREDTVGDDELTCLLGNGLELTLQIRHIRVTVTQYLSVTQTASIVDRGVVLAVIEDIIILTADSGDDSEVRLETGRDGHRLLVTRERCYLALQLKVQIERTVQETTTAHTCTVFIQRRMSGCNNCLVLREAEVVIGTQHNHTVVLHLHYRCLTALQLVEIRVDTQFADLFEGLKMVTFIKKIH